MTQKKRIEKILRQQGYIDNFYCIENKITLRLASVIATLVKQGWQFDEQKSGFIRGTKNWRYVVQGAAPRDKDEFIRGVGYLPDWTYGDPSQIK